MKLTVLGNNGPYPSKDGACSGYLIQSDSGSTSILLDCGTGSLAALRRYLPLEKLSAVLLSHLHYDHMSDMLPMHYALQFSSRELPLNVYAPQEPAEVRALLRGPHTDVWVLRDVTIGEMKISVCPARHPIPTWAIKVECDGAALVYTGDTNTDTALEFFCDGADLLLADAGLSEADWKETAPHLSAKKCGQLAKDTRAKQLLLTHLNPKYDPQALLAEAAEVYPKAELAERGQVYYL